MSKLFGYNFGTIYRFEIMRSIRKKSFWLMLLSVPVLFSIVLGLSYLSNKSTSDSIHQIELSQKITVVDDSGTIKQDDLVSTGMAAQGVTTVQDFAKQKQLVIDGKLDAVIHYPKDLNTGTVEIAHKHISLVENSVYQTLAERLLSASIRRTASPETLRVLDKKITYNDTTYRDGKPYNALADMIAPGVFLVVFYLVISVYGTSLVNATTEEKENRVAEIILTTVNSRTLISAKILAYLSLIFIQVLNLIAMLAIIYVILLCCHLPLPINFDIHSLIIDWGRVGLSLAIFILSTLLISGTFAGLGALAQSAKEASQYGSSVMLAVFIPLYAMSSLVQADLNLIGSVFLYVPFTAPLVLFIRNAAGVLTMQEASISLGIMSVAVVVVFILAAKLFQIGAIAYDERLSLKRLLNIFKLKKA